MTAGELIPEGYPQLTPYLCVDDAEAAIQFYVEVFDARERMRLPMPDGSGVGHCELEIGEALVMLSDEAPDMGALSPRSIGGTAVTLSLYVDDVDVVFARALEAGAKELRPVSDQFYGDRAGQLEDPFGHRWGIATHVEEVPPEEMEQRMDEAFGGDGG